MSGMQCPVASRPTWIEVDHKALAANVGQIRQCIGPQCLLMAVVKANAYGHGAVTTAKCFLAAGADRLAVATLDEAIELRQGNIESPVLVLGYVPPWQTAQALRSQVTLTVFDIETLRQVDAQAAEVGRTAMIHVKVNTGMNRLGTQVAETVEFLRYAAGLKHVQVEGLYTHFATADTERAFAGEQFARFRWLLEELEQTKLRPPLIHAANSAATVTMPETHLNMVRCGIALYGLHPDEDGCRLSDGFRPALSWKATVVHTANLAPGEAVSYGREFVARRPMRIAVIPVGYADGFPRRPINWGHVLIHGLPAPLLGRVCMDQTVVDITEIERQGYQVVQGDEVVLIGAQGNGRLSVEAVARRIGTINYDVVSRILGRVPRVVVNGDADG